MLRHPSARSTSTSTATRRAARPRCCTRRRSRFRTPPARRSRSHTPPNLATYSVGQIVTANYSCSDPSGVAACTGPVPSGTAIDTSTAGNHTFTVNATDSLGNHSSQSVTYSVVNIPVVKVHGGTATSAPGGTVPFTVSITKPPTGGNVTMSYQTQDDTATAGVNYTSTSGNLTFTPTGALTQTVNVGLLDNGTPGADHRVRAERHEYQWRRLRICDRGTHHRRRRRRRGHLLLERDRGPADQLPRHAAHAAAHVCRRLVPHHRRHRDEPRALHRDVGHLHVHAGRRPHPERGHSDRERQHLQPHRHDLVHVQRGRVRARPPPPRPARSSKPRRSRPRSRSATKTSTKATSVRPPTAT